MRTAVYRWLGRGSTGFGWRVTLKRIARMNPTVLCILRKAPPQRVTMCSLESIGPMDLVCIDFFFLKLDTDSHTKSFVLVIIDHYARFARAGPMRAQSNCTWGGRSAV